MPATRGVIIFRDHLHNDNYFSIIQKPATFTALHDWLCGKLRKAIVLLMAGLTMPTHLQASVGCCIPYQAPERLRMIKISYNTGNKVVYQVKKRSDV